MKAYSKNVNGLRGLCALLVFLRHVWTMPRIGGWWGDATNLLLAQLDTTFDSFQFGVEVFFTISGYLIAGALQRAVSVRAFAVSRVLRVYPVFAVTHLVLSALGPMMHYKIFVGIDGREWCWLFITNFLLLPGVFHLPLAQLNAWSLSFEAAFYLYSATVFLLSRKLGRTAIWALAVFGSGLFCWHSPRALFFVSGAVLHFVGDRAATLGRQLWASPYVAMPLLFAVLEIASRSATLDDYRTLYGVGSGIGLILLASVLHDHTSSTGLLRRPVMQYFGTISYSFYLWHAFILAGLRQFLPVLLPGLPLMILLPTFLILGLAGSLLVSHLSFLLIEQCATMHLRRLLRRDVPVALSPSRSIWP